MKTQFTKINIFIAVVTISLLGIFVLPNTTKAWNHYPVGYNHSSVSLITNTLYVVSPGGYATLSWTSQNVYACTKTGDWYGNTSASGSEMVTVSRNSKYEITCANTNGGTSYDFVLVYTDQSTSYPSYSGPSYGNSSNSNNAYNTGSSNSGAYNPNLILNIKSRDSISSSSFTKEISSQPGRVIDFQVNIDNNSTNKVGSMLITLPSRLSYVNGSAHLNGSKLNISSISSIDLSYLGASSQNSLVFQASVAPYNSFSENTTVLGVNASVKSATGSAYMASDYTNILIYKNGNGSEGVVLGASTVNTGTGVSNTVLISFLTGLLAVLFYLLIKFYKFFRKGALKETDRSLKTSISEKFRSCRKKTHNLASKTISRALEIYDL